MQKQNLYHPTTVTSPPTHSGSGEYVGAVIRCLCSCSLWWYQPRSEFSSLPSSHKRPHISWVLPEALWRDWTSAPVHSSKAVSLFSSWSSVTGSLLKDTSRCLRLPDLNKRLKSLLIPQIRMISVSVRKDNEEAPMQRCIRYDSYLTKILN